MMRRPFRLATLLLPGCLAVGLALPVFAVNTSYWTQTSEADFKGGTLESVVATNLGELKLSRAVKTLLEQDPQISAVNKLAEAPDGTIYAGTGPNAVLLGIKDQKVSQVAKIDDATDILSLTFDTKGRLLIGTGGDKGRILRIDKPGEKPHEIFAGDGVQYIWAMEVTPDGNIYAATGPEGKLFEITDAGSKVLLKTEENNLLSLVSDGKQTLYVGTDPHGLVYRVDRKTGAGFVLYNAVESEISALVLDKQGNLYAATSEAREESPQQQPAMPDEDKNGRPDGGATGVPIPGDKGNPPAEPAPPDPNPGRPDPIPKTEGTAPKLEKQIDHSPMDESPAAAPRFAQQALLDARGRAHVYLTLAGGSDAPPAAKRKPNPGPPPTVPGKPQPQPGNPPTSQTAPDSNASGGSRQPNVDANQTGEPRADGNAVYKIDTDGFVTEVFRQNVLVLGMVENNGTLLLATGSEGQVYQVNPAAGETVEVAKVDAKQVMCLLPARDGNVYMGMANVGSVAMMSSGYANKGTFTSPVLDATQISRFGKMQLRGSLPAGTAITVSTRSGNVKEASDQNWSKWTEPVEAAAYLPVQSPSARFLQYRLTLTSKDGKTAPLVDDVNIAYQIPNMAPQVKAIRLAGSPDPSDSSNQQAAGGGDNHPPAPTHHYTIAWDASDPNGDALQYTLYFRRGSGEPWILLKDELTDASYDWDTRAVADGRYEVKVVASDALANAPGDGKTASRVSDSVLVDNTPPVIGDLKWAQKGDVVHIDLRAYDRSSTVASVEYAVDSAKDWQLVLPVAHLYDSPEAKISMDLKNLPPGDHQVAFRATDSRGNQSFENLFVKVEGPAASR